MDEYCEIIVNKWRVVFRERDHLGNRLKIANIKNGNIDLTDYRRGEIFPFDVDDCNGDEFAQVLNYLVTRN